ncbi:hypothetical protein A2U01_0038650, partial [Trifolium medium]|nr:hypothetical protein [Trifolium medium]
MSDSAKSTHMKNTDVPSLSQGVIATVPISIVHPLDSEIKEQHTTKKEDSSQVSKELSLSASTRKPNRKRKNFKSSKSYTMTELYLENPSVTENVSSKGTTSVVETTFEGVETSVKISEILGQDNPNIVENLGVDNPKSSDNLGKEVNIGSSVDEPIVNDSTKGSSICVDETLKGTVPETDVVPD